MIKPFGQDLSDIKAYGNDVVKVMAFGEEAWSRQTTIHDYLCFTALEAGKFTLTVPAAVTSSYLSYVEYSKDGRTWNHKDISSSIDTISVEVVQGDKVYWRGSGVCMTSTSVSNNSVFSSDAEFNVSGHLLSLLQGDNYTDNALVNYNTSGIRNVTFARLFAGCTKLISAEDLVLPKFSSWYTYILYNTFSGCTGLVTAPSLPSTDMSDYCYQGMFLGCTSLLAASDILATTAATDCCRGMYNGCSALTSMGVIGFTTMATGCCRSMFQSCSSLVAASPLLFTTMAENCCYYMFYGCSSLNYVKCLATDISATNCLQNWLYNVSSTGTFIQASGVSWPSGASGIPSTWLIYEEGGARLPIQFKEVEYVETGARSANNRIEIGTIRNQYEVFEVKAQAAQLDTTYNQSIAGYSEVDTTTTPKQASQSYFYLRANPDSFQHQIYRINGDSYSSSNGLLQNTRDTSVHTYKIDYEISSSTGHHLRYAYFDGTLKISSTATYETMKSGTAMCLFGTTNDNYNAYLRIMEFKWFESDGVTLYKHLIPCKRVSDSKAGYFDLIGKAFFTSVNNLTAGAEI